jgi:hypothetical protein
MKIAVKERCAELDLKLIKEFLVQEDPIVRKEHQSQPNVERVTGDQRKEVKLSVTAAPVLIQNFVQLIR